MLFKLKNIIARDDNKDAQGTILRDNYCTERILSQNNYRQQADMHHNQGIFMTKEVPGRTRMDLINNPSGIPRFPHFTNYITIV